MKKYENVKIEVLFFLQHDNIMASNEEAWHEEIIQEPIFWLE